MSHVVRCPTEGVEARHCTRQPNSNDGFTGSFEIGPGSEAHLAASYQFAESLERVLLDADERQAALLPDPPAVAVFPPPGVAFDPDSFALLTAVYSKAIEGQPASAHEGIAKRIIALASKGERDPDKLRHGALGQSTHLLWSAG